jgi:hypothetical protein
MYSFSWNQLFDSKLKHKYGKDYNMLRYVAKGRPFRVLSIPHEVDGEPNGSVAERVKFIEALAQNLIAVSNKDGKTLLVITQKGTSLHGWFTESGIRINRGEKTLKRVHQLVKPYTLFGEFDSPLDIQHLEETDIFLMDVGGVSDDKSLFDGIIFIREDKFQELLAQSRDRLKDDPQAVADLDHYRDVMVWNGRIFLSDDNSLVKGQVFRTREIQSDLVYHSGNQKKEISMNNGKVFIGLDPQPGKLEAYAGKSLIQNYPWVFGITPDTKPEDMVPYQWLVAELDEKLENVKTGKVQESLPDVLKLRASKVIEAESHTTNDRVKLARLSEHKDPRCFPSLLTSVSVSGIERMVNTYDNKVRIKIPGGMYVQNMPAAVLKFCGVNYDIPPGYCMFDETYQVLVVNDQDYLDNQRNHGGQDLDDKLCVIFVRWLGKLAVFMHRNPSARDEFNVKLFIGISPVGESGLTLPDVLPPTAVENDRVLGALPKPPRTVSTKGSKDAYTLEDIIADMKIPSLNPGSILLAMSLWDHAHPQSFKDGKWISPRNPFLCQKEDVVDSTVQLRDSVSIRWILTKAQTMLWSLVNDYKGPLDPMLFDKTAGIWADPNDFFIARKRLEKTGRFKDCQYTSFVKLCYQRQKETKKAIKDHILENRIRTDFLILLEKVGIKLTPMEIRVGMERYESMCGAYGSLPEKYRRFKKGRQLITLEGYQEVAKVVNERFLRFVKFFKNDSEPRARAKALVLMAHAAHNSKGRLSNPDKDVTDHIVARTEFFDDYLKMVVKHSSF